MRFYLLLLIFGLLLSPAHAGRVAIVVDHGSYVQTSCVSYSGTKTAADILESSGLGAVLADFGGLGKAVCKIGGTGCPASNCFCTANYWAFYYSDGGSWTESGTGVSFHTVGDGQMLGFRWTSWPPEEPEMRSFSSICSSTASEEGRHVTRHLSLNITNRTGTFCAGEPVALRVLSIEDRGPVWEPSFNSVRREVFFGTSIKVFHKDFWWNLLNEGETNSSGYFEFLPGRAGQYSVEISKRGFVPSFATLQVSDCSLPECGVDSDCAYDKVCEQGECVQLAGSCGYVENHEFVEYECCSDGACASGRCEDHRCAEPDDWRLKEIMRVLFNYYI